MQIATAQGGPETQKLRPLSFTPGVNNPNEIQLEQLKINVAGETPWLEIEPLKDKPLVIVAGGPSLKYRIDEIAAHEGYILALNGAYDFLLEHGITPDYVMIMDSRRENIEFVRRPRYGVRHFLAAQCHPDIFKALSQYDTTLYFTTLQGTLDAVKDDKRRKIQLTGTAGTVGMKALSLAYALGFLELHLYGYDSSYEDGAHHAFDQPLNDNANTIEVFLDNLQGSTRYLTTPAFAHQAVEFPVFAQSLTARSGMTIDLHCSGLLPDMVERCNKEGEMPLEWRERWKYEMMWMRDEYRKDAPGEGKVEDAIASLGMKTGELVTDFGCGTGRAAAKFQDMGYKVAGVDFAANCLDPGVDIPFVQACLWEMSPMTADWGFCTDVMEHIPPEKAMTVLRGIAERCEKGAFFNIATREDVMGGLIGRRLHMCVMEGPSWKDALQTVFKSVEMREGEGEAVFICKH